MAAARRPSVNWRSRALTATFGLAILALLLAVGVLLANTHGAADVAGNARALHWTNATKGAAGIARASVAQAVFFSFDDVFDARARADAVSEAANNMRAVAHAVGSNHSDPSIDEALSEFLATSDETLELAEAGRSSLAEASRLNDVEPAYATLDGLLEDKQTDLAIAISNSERAAGQISRVTFVLTAFLIPAVTMLVFWFVLRRRVRNRESEMYARLEAERDLNRAKDELIAGLSHELRTPLTTIFGFSEILLEDPSITGEARESLNLINASSADLSRMVNDLLTAARLDAEALTTNREQFDLAVAVSAVAEPYLRSGEKLTLEVPSLDVYSDPLHVRQIVHNLVSNSLRHGGEQIAISASRKKNKIVLIVADNGSGIPDEMTGDLFKRFAHKGHEAVVAGSVGLGLAISHELARELGGGLRYSRVEGWTTFTLTLPAMLTKDDLQLPAEAADRSVPA